MSMAIAAMMGSPPQIQPPVSGHWWLPHAPEQLLRGVVAWDSGLPTLSLQGSFANNGAAHDAIFGDAMNGRRYTLQGVHGGFPVPQTTESVELRGATVLRVFEGIHAVKPQDLVVARQDLRFGNAEAWFHGQWHKIDAETGHAETLLPGRERFSIDDGILVEAEAYANPSFTLNPPSATAKGQLVYRLHYEQPRRLAETSTERMALESFHLLASQSASPCLYRAFRTPVDGHEVTVKLLTDARTWEPRHSSRIMFLFTRDDLPDWDGALRSWLRLYRQNPFILESYMTYIQERRFSHEKFLILAPALEAFHRSKGQSRIRAKTEHGALVQAILERLSGDLEQHQNWVEGCLRDKNTPSFMMRMKALLAEHFGPLGWSEEMVNAEALAYRDTRNAGTHQREKAGRHAKQREEYEHLVNRAFVLLTLCLLKDIGLPDDDARRWASEQIDGFVSYWLPE